MTASLALAARVISEGFLPARSALLQGPGDPVEGPVRADRIRGMLLGLAVGDALGNTSKGLAPAEREARWGEITDYLPNDRAAGHRVGLPSGVSQLAFRTVESLLECGAFDPDDLSARLAAPPIFGVGRAVRQFVDQRASGITPWYRCGAESAGSGALMRIAPIVLQHPGGSNATLWLDAALASIVTHRDACSVASCVAFADLLAWLLRLPERPPGEWLVERFIGTVRQVCTDQAYRPRAAHFGHREEPFAAFLEFALGEARRHRWSSREACAAWASGAYLLETVPSVLWILAEHGHDPEAAIVRAINDTADNDTIAAIVGAAVGAIHGAPSLPERWRRGLLGRIADADDGRVFRLVEAAAARDWG